MFLLQTIQQTQVTDITFRMMDVVYIVMGTITIVSAIFVGRNAVNNLQAQIASEVDKAKVQFDYEKERHKQLSGRVLDLENSVDSIETKIDEKIEKIYDLIRSLTNNINEMEKKILDKIRDNK